MADNTQTSKPKRKISKVNIAILVILLILLGLFISVYVQNESQLGECQSKNDCGRYNVFYIKGNGYVCANDQVVGEKSIKSKILMFKYASNKAVVNEPSGCSCVENQCETN